MNKVVLTSSPPDCWENEQLAMCCECGEMFHIEQLKGNFMARRCPLCECRLHEGAFDERARLVTYRARNAWYRHEEEKMQEAHDELSRLAMARYLTSEWYLLTGTPTSMLGFDATEEGYSFSPAYDDAAKFVLRAEYGTREVNGIRGEMALFDSLRIRVNDRNSPLYGSKIVPSTCLATSKDNGKRLKVRRNQTDCVLLTYVGAFVLEAKRWRAEIHVDASEKYMEVKRGRSMTFYGHDTGPIAQARANRKALLRHYDILSGERVNSIVVFVDPIELTGDMGELPCGKGVYFGQVVTGGKSGIRKEIERCVKLWATNPRNVIDADISELAGELLWENSQYELPIDPRGRM